MSMSPTLSIVISFLGFCWIFAKKVYPHITKYLDDYIDSIKKNVSDAENFKNDAYSALKDAYVHKDDTEEIIRENRTKSEEKIKRLKAENVKSLHHLRERHTASLKVQLDAELAKQKNFLIERLSDVILLRLSEKISNSECNVSTSFDKEDLQKLLGSQR
jgi:F0F1-type ATP synthase membrane subunit b/b'